MIKHSGRSIPRTLCFAAALTILVSCGPGAPPTEDAAQTSPDPSLDIPAVVERYLTAVAERDTAELRNLLATDGRLAWLENGAVAYRTPDDLIVGLAAFPPETPIRTELGELSVVGVGDRSAHAWATFATTIGEGQDAFSFGGMLSFVWEHTGGEWLLVGGHASSPGGG